MASRFRTQFDPSPQIFAEPGSPVKTLYGPIFDDRGIMHLTEVGLHNLYAEIQSHAESVDIHVLIQRYQSGDVEALSRVQGAYGDFTQMPTTFAEALNTMIAAEQYFLSLPPDVRARYGHDFNQFIASMDSPTFASDIGLVPPAATPGTDPFVSSNPGSTGSVVASEASGVFSTGPDSSLAAAPSATPAGLSGADPN